MLLDEALQQIPGLGLSIQHRNDEKATKHKSFSPGNFLVRCWVTNETYPEILLMDKILHRLVCIKPCK